MAAPNPLESISDVLRDRQGKERFKCKISYQCGGSKVQLKVKPPSTASRLLSFIKRRFRSKEVGEVNVYDPYMHPIPQERVSDTSGKPNLPTSCYPEEPDRPSKDVGYEGIDDDEPYEMYELPGRACYLNLPAVEARDSDTSGEPKLSNSSYPGEPDRPEKEEDIYHQESTETYMKLKQQSEMNRLYKTQKEAKGLSFKEVIQSQGDKTSADYIQL